MAAPAMSAPPPGPPPAGTSSATRGCLIALGVVVLLGVLVSLAFIFFIGRAADELDETFDEIEQEIDENTGTADPDDYEIALTACIADPGALPVAEGTMTNLSDQDRAFNINVSFTADDVRLGSSSTYVSVLDQDGTTAWRASSLNPLPSDINPSDVSCIIDGVEYAF
jgi:hypothetical protein